jgi:hypothetical protein
LDNERSAQQEAPGLIMPEEVHPPAEAEILSAYDDEFQPFTSILFIVPLRALAWLSLLNLSRSYNSEISMLESVFFQATANDLEKLCLVRGASHVKGHTHNSMVRVSSSSSSNLKEHLQNSHRSIKAKISWIYTRREHQRQSSLTA